MKKFLVFLIVLMGVSFVANAQPSCKISGANDGSSIMVTYDSKEGNMIVVDLENDSNSICANVTVEVEVTYQWINDYDNPKKTKTYVGSVKSCPYGTAAAKIYISDAIGDYKYLSYRVISVKGNKCN